MPTLLKLLLLVIVYQVSSLISCYKTANIFKLDRLNEAGKDDIELSKVVKLSDDERLQKVIARAGLASRRAAEKLVSTVIYSSRRFTF